MLFPAFFLQLSWTQITVGYRRVGDARDFIISDCGCDIIGFHPAYCLHVKKPKTSHLTGL